ncbi:ACT domain-containing protein [Tepidiforma thermophila]|nr:ACT domain-containing protein [Tepidiforma thermophila]
MAVVRAIRLTMPDRPGALSAVATALAAHRVDIVRLDVVSHEGSVVVDDLLLRAASAEDIGAAIGGFWPEVAVRTFDAPLGDPAVEMGMAIANVTGAPTQVEARSQLVTGISRVMRADRAAVLRCIETGGFVPVVGLPATAVVGPHEPFAGRWVLARGAAAAFPAADGWVPAAFASETGAAWVAIAPLGTVELAVAIRTMATPFYRGELERLDVLAKAVTPVFDRGRGFRGSAEPGPGGTLPARAITLGAA